MTTGVMGEMVSEPVGRVENTEYGIVMVVT